MCDKGNFINTLFPGFSVKDTAYRVERSKFFIFPSAFLIESIFCFDKFSGEQNFFINGNKIFSIPGVPYVLLNRGYTLSRPIYCEPGISFFFEAQEIVLSVYLTGISFYR